MIQLIGWNRNDMKEKRVFFGLFVCYGTIFFDLSCNNAYGDTIKFCSATLAAAYNDAVCEMFGICYAHDYGAHDYGFSRLAWVLG